jgi:hypothetical protein
LFFFDVFINITCLSISVFGHSPLIITNKQGVYRGNMAFASCVFVLLGSWFFVLKTIRRAELFLVAVTVEEMLRFFFCQ